MRRRAGWVICYYQGFYHGGVQAIGNIVNNALESKMKAILMAIQHAWSRGYNRVSIESDCQEAIEILNGTLLHFDAYKI